MRARSRGLRSSCALRCWYRRDAVHGRSRARPRGRAAGCLPGLRPYAAGGHVSFAAGYRAGSAARGCAELLRSPGPPELESAVYPPPRPLARSAIGRAGERGGPGRGGERAPRCSSRALSRKRAARARLRHASSGAALDQRNERVLLALGLLAVVSVTLLMLIFGRAIFRPLDRLRAAAKAVGAGDLQHPPALAPPRRAGSAGARVRLDGGPPGGPSAAQARGAGPPRPADRAAQPPPLPGDARRRARRGARSGAPARGGAARHRRLQARQRGARPSTTATSCSAAAAAGLGEAMRSTWGVARVGGDEFGLVLPDAEGARVRARRAARAAVEVSAPVRGVLRCSAGVASFPEDAKSAGALLQLAAGACAGPRTAAAGARAATTPSTSSWSPRSSARTSRR